MDSIKDGGVAGAGFGFSVAGIRLYMSAGGAPAHEATGAETVTRAGSQNAGTSSSGSHISQATRSTITARSLQSSVRFHLLVKNKHAGCVLVRTN